MAVKGARVRVLVAFAARADRVYSRVVAELGGLALVVRDAFAKEFEWIVAEEAIGGCGCGGQEKKEDKMREMEVHFDKF